MVQVISQEGTPEKLGAGFGEGLSSGLQMLLQAKMEGMQRQRQQQGLAQTLGGLGGPDAQGAPGEEEFQEIPAQQLAMLATEYPEAAKILGKEQERKRTEFAKKKETANLQKVFGEMERTLKGGRLGVLQLGRATAEGRRDRQYFDTLAVGLENIASTMVGKGVLSKPRFEFLLKNLPNSNKTDARNEGSLKAWALELGLNPGIVEVEGVEEQMPKGSKKAKSLDQILFR